MFLFSHSHPAFVTMGSHLLLLPHPVEALGVWGITSSAMHLDVQAISSIRSVSSTAAMTGGLRERPGGVLPLHDTESLTVLARCGASDSLRGADMFPYQGGTVIQSFQADKGFITGEQGQNLCSSFKDIG